MKRAAAALCLAAAMACGCVTTSGEPRLAGEPPATGGFAYPYNSRW